MHRAESRRYHAQDSSSLPMELYGEGLNPATTMCDSMDEVLLTSEAHPSIDIQCFYWGWSLGAPEVTH